MKPVLMFLSIVTAIMLVVSGAKANVDSVWVRSCPASGTSFDEPSSIVRDQKGDISIAGYITTPTLNMDLVVSKYSNDGEHLWTETFNGSGNFHDVGTAIASDPRGCVYVTGWSYNPGIDFITLCYDSSGARLWASGRDCGMSERASDIVVDENRNSIITGTSTGSSINANIWIIKYDSLGQEQWARMYPSPGIGYDSAAALALDHEGNIYVAGGCYRSSGIDFAVLKYDSV